MTDKKLVPRTGEEELGSGELETLRAPFKGRVAPKPVGQDLLIEMPIRQTKQRPLKYDQRVQLKLFENTFRTIPGGKIDIRYKISNNLDSDLRNIRLVIELEGPVQLARGQQVQLTGVQQMFNEENYPLTLPAKREYRGTIKFIIPISARQGKYKGGLYAKFG